MSYQAVILTVSDSCAAGTRTDTSGPAIRGMLENAGFVVQAMQTVPDEEGQISAAIVHACDILQADLVVTTGGTGLSPRDVTPEATLAVLDREIRAIPVAMWVEGLKSTPRAMLSRAVAGIRGHTLVLNVPGSGKGGARKSRRRRRDARSRAQNARGRRALTKQKTRAAAAARAFSFLLIAERRRDHLPRLHHLLDRLPKFLRPDAAEHAEHADRIFEPPIDRIDRRGDRAQADLVLAVLDGVAVRPDLTELPVLLRQIRDGVGRVLHQMDPGQQLLPLGFLHGGQKDLSLRGTVDRQEGADVGNDTRHGA